MYDFNGSEDVEQFDMHFKIAPVITVFNASGQKVATYRSTQINSISIKEAVSDKGIANTGNFYGKLLDLTLNVPKNNLAYDKMTFNVQFYYMIDDNQYVYDSNNNEIGYTFETEKLLNDISVIADPQSTTYYDWVKCSFGNFYVTSCQWDRKQKCYDLELTDLPAWIDYETVTGTSSTLGALFSGQIQTILNTYSALAPFSLSADSAACKINLDLKKEATFREVMSYIALTNNANICMARTDYPYPTFILRRFGTNQEFSDGLSWTTKRIADFPLYKCSDFYEDVQIASTHMSNVNCEKGGLYMFSGVNGSYSFKDRLFLEGQWSNVMNAAFNNDNPVFDYRREFEIELPGMFQLDCCDCFTIDDEEFYIADLEHQYDNGICKTILKQNRPQNGDYLAIQVSDTTSIASPTPPTPSIEPLPLDEMDLTDLGLLLDDYYGGLNIPQITVDSKIKWSNNVEWTVGDTITVNMSAISPSNIHGYSKYIYQGSRSGSNTVATVGDSHAAAAVTFELIGINHDTISGTSDKALLTFCQKDILKANIDYEIPEYAINTRRDDGWVFFQTDYGSITDYYDTNISEWCDWTDTDRYAWLNNDYFNAIDSVIGSKIKAVDKEYYHYDPTYAAWKRKLVSSDKCWLLSEGELLYSGFNGPIIVDVTPEGTPYPYYADDATGHYHKLPASEAFGQLYYNYALYWSRTPHGSIKQNWVTVSGESIESPRTKSGKKSDCYGLAPCFCL